MMDEEGGREAGMETRNSQSAIKDSLNEKNSRQPSLRLDRISVDVCHHHDLRDNETIVCRCDGTACGEDHGPLSYARFFLLSHLSLPRLVWGSSQDSKSTSLSCG